MEDCLQILKPADDLPTKLDRIPRPCNCDEVIPTYMTNKTDARDVRLAKDFSYDSGKGLDNPVPLLEPVAIIKWLETIDIDIADLKVYRLGEESGNDLLDSLVAGKRE